MAAPNVCYSIAYLLPPPLVLCPLTPPAIDMSIVQLNDGTYMPSTGFNTGNALLGLDCTGFILSALNAGYRLIDTAPDHQNAESVGAALQRWSGDRVDVYIVSQFDLRDGEKPEQVPRTVLLEQMKLMQVSYVDMFLLPGLYATKPALAGYWRIMEQLQAEGLTKSIGVSDFRAEDLLELKESWITPPAVNQMEYHPYVYHAPNMLRLRSIMDTECIKVIAYGPLCPMFRSKDGPVDPVVSRIAGRHGVVQGQVFLAWATQHGGGAALTLVNVLMKILDYLQASIEAVDEMMLTQEDLDQIAEAGKGRFFRFAEAEVWRDALS